MRLFLCLISTLWFLCPAVGADAVSDILDAEHASCQGGEPLDRLACKLYHESLYELAVLPELRRVGGEVGWAAVKESIRTRMSPEQIVERFHEQIALRAVELVPAVLSTPLWGFEIAIGQQPPAIELADALSRGVGLCGNQTELFIALTGRLGLKARSVEFWWRTEGQQNTHIAAEVYLNGKWVLFDPTFGAYFVRRGQLLGTKEARLLSDVEIVANFSGATVRRYRKSGADPFVHLHDPKVDVTFAGKGAISLSLDNDPSGALVSNFVGVANYVGDNVVDGDPEGVRFKIVDAVGEYTARIDVLHYGGCANSKLMIDNQSLPITQSIIQFDEVQKPQWLYVRGTDDACYVAMKSLSLIPHPVVSK